MFHFSDLFRSYFVLFIVLTGVYSQASPGDSSVEIRGFGTAAFKQATNKNYLFDYGLKGTDPDYSSLSRFAVNFHSNLSSNFEVAAQFESRGDRGDFQNLLDYGFVAWHPNQNLVFKAGRLRIPLWLYSQQIDVGFSNVWIELPAETYNLTSNINSGTGATLIGRRKVGPGYLRGELMQFETQSSLNVGSAQTSQVSTFSAKKAVAFELTYDIDNRWQFRAAHARAYTSAKVDVYISDGSMGPTTQIITQNLDVGVAQFQALGFRYDSEHFFGSSEWVTRTIEGTALTRARAADYMIGMNLSKWTPYLSYAKSQDLEGNGYAHPDPTYIGVTQVGGHTTTLGLNYHIDESVIIKSQINEVAINYTDKNSDLKYAAYLASIDFVF